MGVEDDDGTQSRHGREHRGARADDDSPSRGRLRPRLGLKCHGVTGPFEAVRKGHGVRSRSSQDQHVAVAWRPSPR